MRRVNWIKRFAPLDAGSVLEAVYETERWVDQYRHEEEEASRWEVLPGKEPDGPLLLSDTGIYAGAAGVALFYLRLYIADKNEKWLLRAKEGISYVIRKYRGVEDFHSDSEFLPGAEVGYLNSPAGGAYVATRLYEVTKEEKYRDFAIRVTKDCIRAGKEEEGTLTWYGCYGIIGEGSLILFFLDMYRTYQEEEFLQAAKKAALYIVNQKEETPWGGARWNAMPTEHFPTIGKPGGYFPGFEYGAAGCGFILASVYEYTKEEIFLRTAMEAAEYILNLADYSEDKEAALVRYNDTYLTDLYYLGVCQGPVGTSRLFYKLFELTGKDEYRNFIEQLTRGILSTGAPAKHSEGYWRTNCYCCGAPGMLEHFINIHKLTGKKEYLDAAYEAAEAIIGESTHQDLLRNWYTQWNRHEPESSLAYTGLYHGSLGCASSLLFFSQYLSGKDYITPYLEDPYKDLFISNVGKEG